MCRRCIRMSLLVIGCALLLLAVSPLLAFLDLGDLWQTAIMASKLIMLPLGALCLIGAAALDTARMPH